MLMINRDSYLAISTCELDLHAWNDCNMYIAILTFSLPCYAKNYDTKMTRIIFKWGIGMIDKNRHIPTSIFELDVHALKDSNMYNSFVQATPYPWNSGMRFVFFRFTCLIINWAVAQYLKLPWSRNVGMTQTLAIPSKLIGTQWSLGVDVVCLLKTHVKSLKIEEN